jgi:hypothetical protein
MVVVQHTPLPKELTEMDIARLTRFRLGSLYPAITSGSIPTIQGPAEATVKKYYKLLHQLARFSLLIRCDQTSLLLFRHLCPDMPGSHRRIILLPIITCLTGHLLTIPVPGTHTGIPGTRRYDSSRHVTGALPWYETTLF